MPRHVSALLTLLLAACVAADAPPVPTCRTPRDAADSLLAWQHPDHFDLGHATACMDAPPPERAQLATQLKEVLDARGLYVPVHALSTDPDFADEQGRHRVQPLPEVPVVIARGDDDLWRYTADTLDAVPPLYRQTFSATALRVQRALPPVFLDRVAGLALWQWAFAAALVACALAVGELVRRVLFVQALRLATRLGTPLDHATSSLADRPLMLVTVFAALHQGVPQLHLPIDLSRVAVTVVDLGLALSSIWLALRVVDVLAALGARAAGTTASKLDDQLVPLVRSSAHAAILAVGSLGVLATLGIDVWKLVAGVSVGGLVVGLAAQDTMKNFFGSLNVFVDRPFQIGDWVILGGVEGVVEEVGFRSTRIRTFYNSQVTVPNSTITSANVDNMGRRPRRRVKTVVGLTYDTPPDTLAAFVEGVRAILAAHPAVESTFEVHFNDFGASSLDVLVYYHLLVDTWHEELTARQENLLEIVRLARALGVSFAFPSTSLYVESTPDRPLAPREPAELATLGAVARAFGPGGERSRPHGPAFPDGNEPRAPSAKGS